MSRTLLLILCWVFFLATVLLFFVGILYPQRAYLTEELLGPIGGVAILGLVIMLFVKPKKWQIAITVALVVLSIILMLVGVISSYAASFLVLAGIWLADLLSV